MTRENEELLNITSVDDAQYTDCMSNRGGRSGPSGLSRRRAPKASSFSGVHPGHALRRFARRLPPTASSYEALSAAGQTGGSSVPLGGFAQLCGQRRSLYGQRCPICAESAARSGGVPTTQKERLLWSLRDEALVD